MDAIKEAWDLAMHILSTVQPLWRDAVICLALSMVGTQWSKTFIARSLSGIALERTVRLLAFILAAAPLSCMYPTHSGFLLAALTGVSSPLIYRLTVAIVGKRWPDLVAALSADSPAFTLRSYSQGRRPSREPPCSTSSTPSRQSSSRD